MKVDYAPRAKADLVEIAEYSRETFGHTVASALETYMRATVARIAAMPESGVSVPKREGVRVVPLVRYPFRIFYAVSKDTVTILHVRHTAQKPW
jgi:addiction module RelE/StbE family toxin